jgi:hypothetical protein
MEFKEIGCEDVVWTHLAQDRACCEHDCNRINKEKKTVT